MGTSYETDVVAWAMEQAALLRAREFSAIDIGHIAEEIEDVARSEQRELASRMAALLAQLLKWQWQPERRGASWQTTLRIQRTVITRRLDDAGLHAGEHPGAEGYPFGYAPGAARANSVEDR